MRLRRGHRRRRGRRVLARMRARRRRRSSAAGTSGGSRRGTGRGLGPGEQAGAVRVERGDRAVARHQDRHLGLLLAVEVGERRGRHRARELGQRRLAERRRLGRVERVHLGHHQRQLLDRGELHPLDALQHGPSAVAEPDEEADQHQDRTDPRQRDLRHPARLEPRQREVGAEAAGHGLRRLRTARLRGARLQSRRRALGAGEAALLAEAAEDLVGVELEVARIGPHVAGDEARVRERPRAWRPRSRRCRPP